jgi:putative PIN family toxin of toxin-antitoxin system
MILRIVIDTDVMVAAFESAYGASRQLVVDVLDGRAILLLSTSLMLEYEDVLTRPETLARSKLTVAEVLEVLDELARLCTPVAFDYRWRPAARDADDDLVLETAINGSADVIASFNTRDMITGAQTFGIPVERPAVVLRRIRR